MARTQAADYDKKRDIITKRAAKLFAQSSYSGASVSELASACKVSKALLYHYYPSKESILFGVMNAHIEDLLTVIDREDYNDRDPRGNFRRFSRALLRRYTGAADSQKVLLYELNNLPAPQRAEIVTKQRRLVAFAEELLTEAAPRNGVDRTRLRAQVMLFFGMLNWSHTWFDPRGPISRARLADLAADTILSSLEVPAVEIP